MKILLLEDDIEIANNIKDYLNLKENWKVDIADSIEKAKSLLKENVYDLLLFDVMLPDGESYDFAKDLKQNLGDIPIIFITAKGELEDKLHGFDSGGDDYITKPFLMDELIARIKAVLRRYNKDRVELKGGVVVDLDKKEVFKNGKKIDLNKTEYAILEYLVKNRGKIVTRTNLIDYLWGEDAIWNSKFDNRLDVYISGLRKKLGKGFILTVKGVGYKL